MSKEQPSFSEIVREQLRKNLSHTSCERCFQLLYEMHYRLLAPSLFRKKMKFLCRKQYGLLILLNRLLPDEYQFTDDELQEDASNYQELKKLKVSIAFVNELTKQVDSSDDFRKFYELIKSHKRKEMDDTEFYGSAYKFMRGDFHLMKKLGNVLNYKTTPSYIKLPAMIKRDDGQRGSVDKRDSEDGDDDDDYQRDVLNNEYSIYSEKICTSTQTDQVDDGYYIYSPDEVIKQSRRRPLMTKGMSIEERKGEAVEWWESRRTELELVFRMLRVAEEEIEIAVGKMSSGDWEANGNLRDYLVYRDVKVKMLEMMKFGDLDKLTREELGAVVNRLRLKKAEVVNAIQQLNLRK